MADHGCDDRLDARVVLDAAVVGRALDGLSILVERTLLSVAFDFVSQPLTCKIKVQSDRRECPSYTSRSI
jgi:hypothetical protein